MSTLSEIKEALPNPPEKVVALSAELDRVQDLKILLQSDGGKQLVVTLRSNAARALTQLVEAARAPEPSMQRMLSLVFDYAANLDLIATLSDSTLFDEIDKQLEDSVREALKQ